MTGFELTSREWLGLLSHVKRWLSNLLRAGSDRRQASKSALRAVVLAVRETEVYMRHLDQGGERNLKTETALALRWTDLSFKLEDLGLHKLAKRCRIKGSYWADPSRYDKLFLEQAGTKLSDIERAALLALRSIGE